MAGIDPSELLSPSRPGVQREPRTVLKGHALYTTDINDPIERVCPDHSNTHEVEVKVDQDGVVTMDIYTPRTLTSSIPLRGGVVPMGVLDNFQVIPSNNRENVLCFIHQTSGRPKHEYLIFERRDEMNAWMAGLNSAVLTNPTRRYTDPTFDHSPPNTRRDGKPLSTLNPDLFSEIPGGEGSRGQHASTPPKSPVEDDYPFEDDINSGDDNTSTPSDGPRWEFAPIAELQTESGPQHQPEIGVPSTASSFSETFLPVPPVTVTARSPSISTVSNAGEISRRARFRPNGRTKSHGELFSQLRQEIIRNELTVDIPIEEACLLKMFDYQGHAWIRDCNGSSGMVYAGDLIIAMDREKVTETKMFRERIEAITAERQEVQLTLKRLPEASLLLVRTLPDGGIPFITDGTKVKSVDVDADEGLFKIAKDGSAYITNINNVHVPYSSTTAEMSAHLQNSTDEFLLVLHPRDFAEKM